MRFVETELGGAWLIELEPAGDARGFFARTFCEDEFAAHGLETRFRQHSASKTSRKHAVRGLHFQKPPHAETKVVTCLSGAIFDVIVDLRASSPTYLRWAGFELTAENRSRLYIPEGFAHGFQTMSDDAEVGYLISARYEPSAASGARHDDPAFSVAWPAPAALLSPKDEAWPAFETSPFA